MTVREAIAYVRALHDNEMDDAMLCRWVSECEARMWTSIMLLQPTAFRPMRWPDDADVVLTAPSPYDEMYTAYLSAKLYLAYHEAQNYQNAMEVFNSAFNACAIWYAASYQPSQGGQIEVRQYPTIVQGETTTFTFGLQYAADEIAEMVLVIGDDLTLDKTRFTFEGGEASVDLTQSETLGMTAGIREVSLVAVTSEGARFETYPPLLVRVVASAVQGVMA